MSGTEAVFVRVCVSQSRRSTSAIYFSYKDKTFRHVILKRWWWRWGGGGGGG